MLHAPGRIRLVTSNPDPSTGAPDDHPCNPDADASVCCGTGWTCLSDGVCKINEEGTDFYYRGTCTDFSWNSQSCPGFRFQQSSLGPLCNWDDDMLTKTSRQCLDRTTGKMQYAQRGLVLLCWRRSIRLRDG